MAKIGIFALAVPCAMVFVWTMYTAIREAFRAPDTGASDGSTGL